jgi:hypothetical protein
MSQHIVVIDPGLGISPVALAKAWNSDDEASAVCPAMVETAPRGDFLGVMEVVVIPAGVGLAVNGVTALVGRLISKLRPLRGEPALEIAELTNANGDQIVVVRMRESSR